MQLFLGFGTRHGERNALQGVGLVVAAILSVEQDCRPMTQSRSPMKVGCCGFVVAQRQYYRLFELIEIQQTFYRLPRLETAAKWRDAAPDGFEFTIKASQLITHEP